MDNLFRFCKHGCGREGIYYFPSTKSWCCSKPHQSCPGIRKKFANVKRKKWTDERKKSHSKKLTGMKFKKPDKFDNVDNILCEYGCGKPAKFKFRNGKVCCSQSRMSCPQQMKIKPIIKGATPKANLYDNIDKDLCSKGCGELAKYKFKNGNVCCSEYILQCSSYNFVSDETKEKLRKHNKKPLSYWLDKYPFFAKIEEMRELKETQEIQVRCKLCNEWFTPTYIQLYERIRNLESDRGTGGSYLYCSDKCKHNCPLFQLHPTISNDPKATKNELDILRKEVLKRQKDEHGYNFCEKCFKEEHLDIHHEKPVKRFPLFVLDPDNGIVLCKKCHFEIGHRSEDNCSTGQIAFKSCK